MSPSNFTIWLKYSFQDENNFYMALPLCTGGDLNYHLAHSKMKCFEVKRAQFYLAEVLEGISHMHGLGIVYRDLKPENVILDNKGYSRISDMGVARVLGTKKITQKAGTPGYWAPQVLNKSPYSFDADYWSLGCVFFEMIYGICPFAIQNTGIQRDIAINKWRIQINENNRLGSVPTAARNLIRHLLDRNAERRWGYVAVKDCDFFNEFDWDALHNRLLDPPFVPPEGQIMAKKQDKINYNKQIKALENQHKKVFLGLEDSIPNFDFVAMSAHESDVVRILPYQKKLMKKQKEKGNQQLKRQNSRSKNGGKRKGFFAGLL